MSPAQRHLIAADWANHHAHDCHRCDPPSIDRPMTRSCGTGIQLDQAFLRTWRGQVLALTDQAVQS